MAGRIPAALRALAGDVAGAEALELPTFAQIRGDRDVAGAAHRILRNAVRRRE